MSIGVAPQHGLIQDQLKHPMLIKRGFVARFLLAMPTSKLGFRDLKPRPISDSVLLAYESRMLELLTFEPNMKDERKVPHVVRLSDSAYRSWKSFQRRIEPMMGIGGRLSDEALTSWAGKLPGNVARLSALIQVGEQAGIRPDEIPIRVDSMDRAIAFGETLIEHAICFHDLADQCTELSKARQLLEWLRDQGRRSEISVREIQQSMKQRSAFSRVDDVREALEVLVENGWVLPKNIDDNGRGRKPEIYFIHPRTYPQYPQNRKAGSTGENEIRSGDIGDDSARFGNSNSANDQDEIEVVF